MRRTPGLLLATLAALHASPARAELPAEPAGASPPPRWVAFVETGGAFLASGADAVSFPYTLRGGFSARYFLAQLTYDRWSVTSSLAAPYEGRTARWSVGALGHDFAALVPLGRSSELRGGVGLHFVSGHFHPTRDDGAAPEADWVLRGATWQSAFLACTVRAASPGAAGLRASVELRKYYGTAMSSDAGIPGFDGANVAIAVTVGAELGRR